MNIPWSGVRPSNLPFALEPETDGTLNYEDPSTVDYCPICAWGDDEPGGAQGRCARADLENLGGYTTFVGNGLLVDLPEVDQTPYLPCRKPGETCEGTNEDGSLKVTTCMAGEFKECIAFATFWFIFSSRHSLIVFAQILLNVMILTTCRRPDMFQSC